MAPLYRVGTAHWALPAASREAFPEEGSHLQRYAALLAAVEINSSFYRPHRPATYARWAASVPAAFRFSLKLPKVVTHEAKLEGKVSREALRQFLDESGALGEKRGPLLVQLPPSLAFEARVVRRFLADFRKRYEGWLAVEPRHSSWFGVEAEQALLEHEVARVVADPVRVPAAAAPGGFAGLVYVRLHGSPRTYWSAYSPEAVAGHAELLRAAQARGAETWCIYDNTAMGHATENALQLVELLRKLRAGGRRGRG